MYKEHNAWSAISITGEENTGPLCYFGMNANSRTPQEIRNCSEAKGSGAINKGSAKQIILDRDIGFCANFTSIKNEGN